VTAKNKTGEEAPMNGKQNNDKLHAAIRPSRRQIIQAGGAAVGTAAMAGFPAPRVRAAGPVRIGYVSPQTGALAPFAGCSSIALVFNKGD